MVRFALAALLLLSPAALLAEEAPETELAAPVRTAEAEKAVGDYLTANKTKKWDKARAALHPVTLAAIADIKKRTKLETHALAPWARVKESYVTNFEIAGARPTDEGAVIVSTVEEHYSVEDKGSEEGVQAEYLVLPVDGVWKLVDRRLGEQVFRDGAVRPSYQAWFDYVSPPKAPAKNKGR